MRISRQTFFDAGGAKFHRRRLRSIFHMSSLVPSQSFHYVSCFAVSQSLLDLGSSTLKKTFVVTARVLETTRTAFYTGGSRKSCTTTSLRHDPKKEGLSELHLAANSTCASGASFHRFPLSEFGLHLSFKSVRTFIECSGSELLLKKAQSSGVLSVSGRRSPSFSLCKRGSVSLLGGCSTPIRRTITISSPPPCATDRYPGDEVLRSWRSSAARNFPIKLKSSEAADVSPNLSSTWARPKLFSRGISPVSISQNINFIERTRPRNCFAALVLFIPMISGGFTEALVRSRVHITPYMSVLKRFSSSWLPVGSSAPSSKTFLMRSVTSPAIKQMKLPKSLTVLLSCGTVCTGPEDATGFVSTIFRGVDWLSTSRFNVTMFQLSGCAVKFTLTHSSCSLNSLSIYSRGFSTSISYVVLSYCFASSARIVSSSKCNPEV